MAITSPTRRALHPAAPPSNGVHPTRIRMAVIENLSVSRCGRMMLGVRRLPVE